MDHPKRFQMSKATPAAPANNENCDTTQCDLTPLPAELCLDNEELSRSEIFTLLDRRVQTSIALIVNEDTKINNSLNILTLTQGFLMATLAMLANLEEALPALRLLGGMSVALLGVGLAAGFNNNIQECMRCLGQHKIKLVDAEKRQGMTPQLELKPRRMLHRITPVLLMAMWTAILIIVSCWLAAHLGLCSWLQNPHV